MEDNIKNVMKMAKKSYLDQGDETPIYLTSYDSMKVKKVHVILEDHLMNKMKLIMGLDNYVCMGDMHIIVNFNKKNLDHLYSLHIDDVREIHIFISNHLGINNNLKSFLMYINAFCIDDSDKRTEVTIHIKSDKEDLIDLLHVFLDECNVNIELVYDNISIMSFRFRDIDNSNCIVEISFHDSHMSMDVCAEDRLTDENLLPIPIIEFPKFYYDVELSPNENQGIFETAEERLDPLAFKDKLITAFKRDCPEGILKSFQTDDDIFEYITVSGDWEVKD